MNSPPIPATFSGIGIKRSSVPSSHSLESAISIGVSRSVLGKNSSNAVKRNGIKFFKKILAMQHWMGILVANFSEAGESMDDFFSL